MLDDRYHLTPNYNNINKEMGPAGLEPTKRYRS